MSVTPAFDHYVITRFNLKLEPHFSRDKNGKPTRTDEWLERRFDLFETVCMPSILGQTCQEFKWLVLFDSETPEHFKKRISSYQEVYPNFIPLYLESGKPLYVKNILADKIAVLSNGEVSGIITTRIDNDDAFHKDMIMDVRTWFKGNPEECFLNFNYGLQFDLDHRVAVKIRYENNHFVSFLEKSIEGAETVIFYDHSVIQTVNEVISVENTNKPMWIELIHETNISNGLKLALPCFSPHLRKSFKINFRIKKLETIVFLLKYLKKLTYETLASFFSSFSLYPTYKKTISICKQIFR